MRYQVVTSILRVVGYIWMPSNVLCSQTITLRDYDIECMRDDEDMKDIENMKDDAGKITRNSVERWANLHLGDFSSIEDFEAEIEIGEDTIKIPWDNEEMEMEYYDATSED